MSQLLCEEQIEEIKALLEDEKDFEEYQVNLQDQHDQLQNKRDELDA